jgi:hypothetical protein
VYLIDGAVLMDKFLTTLPKTNMVLGSRDMGVVYLICSSPQHPIVQHYNANLNQFRQLKVISKWYRRFYMTQTHTHTHTHYSCTLRCTPIQWTKSSPPPFWFPTLLDLYVLLYVTYINLIISHHLVSKQIQYVRSTHLFRNIHLL